jgi:hypothetical protein
MIIAPLGVRSFSSPSVAKFSAIETLLKIKNDISFALFPLYSLAGWGGMWPIFDIPVLPFSHIHHL